MSVTFGATPTTPRPLRRAATMPATCVPWNWLSTHAERDADARSDGGEVGALLAVDVRASVEHEVLVVAVDAAVEDADLDARLAELSGVCLRRVDLAQAPLLRLERVGARLWSGRRC